MGGSKKSKVICPSTAVAKATMKEKRAKGKRTGVIISAAKQRIEDDGFEGMDSYFDGAKSPDPADMAAGDKPVPGDKTTTKIPATRAKKEMKNAAKGINFALAGKAKPAKSQKPEIVKISQGISQVIKSAKDGEFFVSPSDLSHVSTAPPTPASVAEPAKNESPIVTQENVGEESLIETPAGQKAKNSKREENRQEIADTIEENPDALRMDRDSDAFSVDVDEDDDLAPPPPQDDFDNTQEEPETTQDDVDNTKEEPETTQDDFDNNRQEGLKTTQDDFDNNTQEGPKTTQDDFDNNTQEGPETIQDASGHLQEDPGIIQDDADNTQEDPETIQDVPDKTQADPETTQDDPDNTQEDPETTQDHPGVTQEKPETTQADPDNTQEDPGAENSDDHDEGMPLQEDDDEYDDHKKEGVGFRLSDKPGGEAAGGEFDDHNDELDDQGELAMDEEAHPNSALKTPGTSNSASNSVEEDEEGDGFKMASNSMDEGGDKEGEGFNMVHDPETPDSVREERLRREDEKIKQKRKNKDRQKRPAELKDDISEVDATPAKSSKKIRKTKKNVNYRISPEGVQFAPLEYKPKNLEELERPFAFEEPDKPGVRRSKRVHYKPLEFWKNERPIYGASEEGGVLGEAMGNMPVVKHVLKADPTPRKRRQVTVKTTKAKKSRKKRHEDSSDSFDEITPFNDKKLKKKYNFTKGENAMVWNDGAKVVDSQKVISFTSNLIRQNLPLSKSRTREEGHVVGEAAQAFNVANDEVNDNYVGYIMGHLALPPNGIKDSESSGSCSHTFTVCHGQPGALEVSYGDPEEGGFDLETAQRFLLGPGDQFRIPQCNYYRLQNHSTTHDCLLTWTIIKPRSPNP